MRPAAARARTAVAAGRQAACAAGSGGTTAACTGACETESNNTPATADNFASIAVDGRLGGTISGANDVDYFTLTVPQGSNMALSITTFSSGVDTLCDAADTGLTLRASDGTTLLLANGNMGSLSLPTSGDVIQHCSHISYLATPGTYYVQVEAAGGAAVPFNYVLSIRSELVPVATAETEPNDDGTPLPGNGQGNAQGNDFSSAAANGPYMVDMRISGAITPAGDEDAFAISNPGATPLQVHLETFGGTYAACTGIDTQIRIRNAAGTVLAFDDDSSTANCSFLAYVIPANTTVYAQVTGWGDNMVIAAYSLLISFP